jgi:hypothetical protein
MADYGGYGKIKAFRGNTALDTILKPKPDNTGTAAATAEHEIELVRIGKVQVNPQEDGSIQLVVPVADNNKGLASLLDNYREQVSSSSKAAYKAWDGVEYGGQQDLSGIDPLFITGAIGKDVDDGELQIVAGWFKLLGSSGGLTVDPDNPKERTLTLQQLRPKADVVFHAGDQSFTALDATVVDVASEVADISVLADDYKWEYHVAAVA